MSLINDDDAFYFVSALVGSIPRFEFRVNYFTYAVYQEMAAQWLLLTSLGIPNVYSMDDEYEVETDSEGGIIVSLH